MRYANIRDLDEVYRIFEKYKPIFPHIRKDAIERRIVDNQCIFEGGVVITFQVYKVKVRLGTVVIPSGSVMLHQIVNKDQFNGNGKEIFQRFYQQIVSQKNTDLYLCVRKDNETARNFYLRNGMEEIGSILWDEGRLPGVIYFKKGSTQTLLKPLKIIDDRQTDAEDWLIPDYRKHDKE